jgi:hypothetical protein
LIGFDRTTGNTGVEGTCETEIGVVQTGVTGAWEMEIGVEEKEAETGTRGFLKLKISWTHVSEKRTFENAFPVSILCSKSPMRRCNSFGFVLVVQFVAQLFPSIHLHQGQHPFFRKRSECQTFFTR